MTNILLKSRNKIPEHILDILKAVSEISHKLGIETFIVGATARDLIFEYVYDAKIYRATEDIDFGVAVGSWKEYKVLKNILIETKKFEDEIKNEQRIWWNKGGAKMKVDLVPFGGLESPAGQIAFPPQGDFIMSTIGFKEAFENSILLEADENLTVRIASLAGLALLKFIAFNDRPPERRRDVQDICFIAKNYLDAGNEDRLYDEAADADLLGDAFDYQTAGARMLGRDIAPLLNDKTSEIIQKLLAEEEDGGSLQKFADIIADEELRDDDKPYQLIVEIFRQLRKGVFER